MEDRTGRGKADVRVHHESPHQWCSICGSSRRALWCVFRVDQLGIKRMDVNPLASVSSPTGKGSLPDADSFAVLNDARVLTEFPYSCFKIKTTQKHKTAQAGIERYLTRAGLNPVLSGCTSGKWGAASRVPVAAAVPE